MSFLSKIGHALGGGLKKVGAASLGGIPGLIAQHNAPKVMGAAAGGMLGGIPGALAGGLMGGHGHMKTPGAQPTGGLMGAVAKAAPGAFPPAPPAPSGIAGALSSAAQGAPTAPMTMAPAPAQINGSLIQRLRDMGPEAGF